MAAHRQTGVIQGLKGANNAFLKDRSDFLKKLEDFPHLFKLECSKLTQARITSIYERLCREQKDLFKSTTDQVDIRDLNFTAFLLFSMKDVDKAIQITKEVLGSTKSTNLVAMGNMAVMQWTKRNRAEGEELAQRLQNLKGETEKSEFERKVVEGKAEMAYCYSRMGMIFAERAVKQFDDVIQQVPDQYSWKFGLALVLRRFTHLNYKAYYRLNPETSTDHNMKAFELFLEVADCAPLSEMKAHAWAELGMLLQQSWHKELADVCKKGKDMDLNAQTCFENAILHGPQNVDVLNKSGKYFKIAGDLERSRELLERGTKIRDTSAGHHYLGKTFIKLALETNKQRPYPQRQENAKGTKKNPGRSTRRPEKTEHNNVNVYAHNNPHLERQNMCRTYSQPRLERQNTRETNSRQWLQRPDTYQTRGRQHFKRQNASENPREMQTLSRFERNSSYTKCSPYDDNTAPITVSQQFRNNRRSRIKQTVVQPPSQKASHSSPTSVRQLSGSQQTSCSLPTPVRQLSGLHQCGNEAPEFHLENGVSGLTIEERQPETAAHTSRSPPGHPSDVRVMKTVINSPGRLKSLRRDQKYVSDAEHHLKKAIELSHGENVPACMDLGLMYFALDEYELALEQFSNIISQDNECTLNLLQLINAYEQSGLIYLKQSANATDEREKELLLTEGRKMLHIALEIQCDLVKELPKYLPDIKDVWSSFHALWRAAQGRKDHGAQLKEQKHLLRMIGDYRSCLQVLKEIAILTPEEAANPETQEDRLQCYIKLEQFDDAITFLNILETTDGFQEQLRQWKDLQLPMRIRIMTARRLLLNPHNMKNLTAEYKRHFLRAFTAKYPIASSDEHTTLKKCVDDGRDEERTWWHVMILHEPELDKDIDSKALAIKKILQDVCGLRVTCMSDEEDVRPFDNEDFTIRQNAENSQILLVMSGSQKPSEDFQPFLKEIPDMLVDKHSYCKAVLVLNVSVDNCQELRDLKCQKRSLQCPPALLESSDLRNPELINDICKLFCFLVEVDVMTE